MIRKPFIHTLVLTALVLHVLAMLMVVLWSAATGIFESGSEKLIVFSFVLPLILIFIEAYAADRLYVQRVPVSHTEKYHGIFWGTLAAVALFALSVLVFGGLPTVL